MNTISVSIISACVLLAAINCVTSGPSQAMTNLENALAKFQKPDTTTQGLCTCAVFLTGQFTKGSQDPPNGNPALLNEHETLFSCTPAGNKQCTNKCLETVKDLIIFLIPIIIDEIIKFLIFYSKIIKHLPNSATIICGSLDRDCHKERAYLFIQNCNSTWINTNLSAGREFCCKDGVSYKCPLV